MKGIKNLFEVDQSTWFQPRNREHAARAIISSLIVEAGKAAPLRERAAKARLAGLKALHGELAGSPLSSDEQLVLEELGELLVAEKVDESRIEAIAATLIGTLCGNPRAEPFLKQIAVAEAKYNEDFWSCFEEETASEDSASPAAVRSRAVIGADAILSGMAAGGAPVDGATIENIEVVLGGFSKQTLVCNLEKPASFGQRFVVRADMGASYVGASIADEFDTANALFRNGVKVPQPIVYVPPRDGQPQFMVMHWADGAMMGWTPTFRDEVLCRECGYQLGLVHGIPVEQFPHVPGANSKTSEQLLLDIEIREKKWRDSGGTDAIIAYGLNWLRQRIALSDGPRSVVHGDYRGHNILQKEGVITAILDWEHARIANPAHDFGYLGDFPDALGSWKMFVEGYVDAGGIVPDDEILHFYGVYATVFTLVVLTEIRGGYSGLPQQQLATAAAVLYRRPLEMKRLAKLIGLE
ncbi:phosphotransferase [Sphingobium sp. V4]|uniref:phosphotransferase family protein n=1 Tax=Sphingobium sp. V4 TaxID=3038927 RepID=UPI002557CDE5|nr:phosphotransferase [Sphingobium sp. V4]WIW89495.1 phosphotransferase [Sphingobium sp. V4]